MKLSMLPAPLGLVLLVASASAAPVTMAIKFPPGRVQKMTTTMDMDQTMSGGPLPAAMKQKMKMGMDATLKVVSADNSGATVEVTYDQVRMSMSMAGKEMSFDSSKDKASADNLLSDVAGILGVKLTLRFGPDGIVNKVEGTDAMMKKLSTGPGGAIMAKSLSDSFGENQVKQMFNGSLAETLPKKPVAIGDQWESTSSQSMGGMKIKITADNKLKGVEDKNGHKIATIEFSGDGKIDGSAPGGVTIKADQLTQKGTKQFDLDAGCFTQTDMEQQLKGEVTVPGGAGAAMKIEQTVNAKSTFALSDAK
jgi:hypothetical protein